MFDKLQTSRILVCDDRSVADFVVSQTRERKLHHWYQSNLLLSRTER